MRRVHPLPAQGDAVSHHPRVGQVEAGAALHADAAHQHHPPVRPYRHDGGPHLQGIGRGREDVEYAVDRAARRVQDVRAIVSLMAAHRHSPDAGAEPPRQFAQRLLVAPGRDHALRAHPAFRDLLARLRECPEFAGWWEDHDVRGVAAGRKSLIHPKRGRLKLEYVSFQANDDPAALGSWRYFRTSTVGSPEPSL
jgi:hypothetical protein